MVRFVLGRLMMLEALMMLPSLAVVLLYREPRQLLFAFLLPMAVLLTAGLAISFRTPANRSIFALEGFVVVSLSWFTLSLFGCLPFLLSGAIPRWIDAFFEAASGFTTTGASVVKDVEILPRSILFWRSSTHLVGGMGVLVFALAVMPRIGSDAVHILKAEVPGPVFGKIMPRVHNTARFLYLIYLALAAVLVLLLLVGGMPLFDSLIHAFGAAGTGGFSMKNTSIAFYDSAYIKTVLAVGMALFGINFNLYFLLLFRQAKVALKNEELRWYLGFIFISILMISLIVMPQYDSFPRLLMDVSFTVSSIITTTGFAVTDFNTWPLAAHFVLLLLVFCGAMSGSTGGGLKVSRAAIYIKTTSQEVRRAISPNRKIPVRFEQKPLSATLQRSVSFYFMIYMVFFCLCVLIVSFGSPNFTTSFSSVAATLNNIGPGLDMVGPAATYADHTDMSKMTLIVAMIAGRLEIIPVLILFSPRTWRKA